MKKIILCCILSTISISSFSQETDLEILRNYQSVNLYEGNIQKDSLKTKNTIILKNDTLVVVSSKNKDVFNLSYGEINDNLLKEYKNIVFGNEEKRNNYSYKKYEIKLWNSPINLFFHKKVPKYLKQELTSLINEINTNIDSVQINIVNKKEASNYFIYITNSKNKEELHPNINTKRSISYNLQSNGLNHIYSGVLRINLESIYNKEEQIIKLKRLFIGSLGIFHLSDSLKCNNFLSSCYTVNKNLTKMDIDLINFHYKNKFDQKVNLNKFEKIISAYIEKNEFTDNVIIKL
ncbi:MULTISPECIES: DUF2927 domain-containing protein [Winogradskyella]|uniref:DUF2927 domain-containing protein n=1 Tax=Winogradskyella TaxID=286104 RepID=UPI0015CEDC09|nr:MULTISPECIES: DUF2927 domain-containing protein [Winogradskyella]QXP78636.1 DUF2927 domain-containing protein [Winogradskyella sp. HaHa_3_26]